MCAHCVVPFVHGKSVIDVSIHHMICAASIVFSPHKLEMRVVCRTVSLKLPPHALMYASCLPPKARMSRYLIFRCRGTTRRHIRRQSRLAGLRGCWFARTHRCDRSVCHLDRGRLGVELVPLHVSRSALSSIPNFTVSRMMRSRKHSSQLQFRSGRPELQTSLAL